MHSPESTQPLPDRFTMLSAGLVWLAIALIGAAVLFWPSIYFLLETWHSPDYSHGPLIPLLSGLLFLRQLKGEAIVTGPVNRWPGFILMALSVGFGVLSRMVETPIVGAIAMIFWFGAILLICFGWTQGRRFWPPILHLFFMLPLPPTMYYRLSIYLQLISAELGVWLLRLADIPVFLEGYIIDLGVIKLHVAEACSGLRYLFPILSFSYIFAVLFRGSMLMKAIMLLSAAPIAVAMNSARIAIAGVIVQYQGADHLEGFSHFFEGWVIFLLSIILLFVLARVLLVFQREKLTLIEALDLDFSGLVPQARRIGLIEPSAALVAMALLTLGTAFLWQVFPTIRTVEPSRVELTTFPPEIGDWVGEQPRFLDGDVARILKAQDYTLTTYNKPGMGEVEVFAAWFRDQTVSGAHSPEVCLPNSGWEFASFDRRDISGDLGTDKPFPVNRALIQKGEERLLVYYYYVQNGRQVAWDFGSKLWLLWDTVRFGRKDGGLVRLVTQIGRDETEASADLRLQDMARELDSQLPRFFPGRDGTDG